MPVVLGAMVWSVVSWLFRTVVIQFVVMAVVFVIVSQLMPLVFEYIASYINPDGLSGAFSGISENVWFFLDFFALDVGAPMLITAYITRFLIRRIPFIG